MIPAIYHFGDSYQINLPNEACPCFDGHGDRLLGFFECYQEHHAGRGRQRVLNLAESDGELSASYDPRGLCRIQPPSLAISYGTEAKLTQRVLSRTG